MKKLNICFGIVIAFLTITALSSCEKEDIIINNNIGCDQGCVDSLITLAQQPQNGGVSPGSSTSPTALLSQYAQDGDDGWVLSIIVQGTVLQNFLPTCSSLQEINFYGIENNTIDANFEWCNDYNLEMNIIDFETLEIEVNQNLSGSEMVLLSLESDEMKVSYVRTDNFITFIIANEGNPQTATMILQFND